MKALFFMCCIVVFLIGCGKPVEIIEEDSTGEMVNTIEEATEISEEQSTEEEIDTIKEATEIIEEEIVDMSVEESERVTIDINPLITSTIGMSIENLFSKYGEPCGIQNHGGPGGKEYYYEEMKVVFVDAGENGIINNIFLLPGFKFSPEITIGEDNLEKIISIMGSNDIRRDPYLRQYGGELYTIYVFFPEGKYIELWFLENDEGETRCSVLWKGYWNED